MDNNPLHNEIVKICKKLGINYTVDEERGQIKFQSKQDRDEVLNELLGISKENIKLKEWDLRWKN